MNVNHTIKATVCGAMLFAASLPAWGQETKNSLFEGFHRFAVGYDAGQTPAGISTTGISLLDESVLRQTGNRTFPYPVKGHSVITNPPTFTWPSADYKMPSTFPVPLEDKGIDDFVRYDIQLGRTPDFSDAGSFVRKGLRLAFYNHHTALEPGTWYWRYRTAGKEWSVTYEVNIPFHTRKFESPQPQEAYNMIPEEHPRIYKIPEEGHLWTTDQRKLIKTYLQKAKTALTKSPEEYAVKGQPIPPTATAEERAQIEKFRLRYELEALDKDITNLLNAYLYTQNSDFLGKAIALADHVAQKDGEQLYKAADFTGAFSMSTLAMVYDAAYDRLSKTQRLKYEQFISTVMYWNLAQAMQENTGSADGILFAHFFQHTFYCCFTTAIIMKGHLHEAETWFDMLYDIWLSRTPGGGFLTDGVWPNGNMGYLHVNMESMIDNFVLYRDLFNVNLFTHPWYENCANALAYTVPAGSAGDGFGDGCERWQSVNKLRADFAYILSQELDNPFAANYAYTLAGQNPDTHYQFNGTSFARYRLSHRHTPLKRAMPDKVPQSAVFPQTGIVVMNTDVMNTPDNLFVSFVSSPFGVGSHGMAEQNSFNLSYKGKPVFYPTGYRITTRDKHYLLAQKHSRAKNTVTVDGKTQAYSSHGYGWIARYLDGKDITYTLGDASNAYKKFDRSAVNWITVLEKAGVYKPEYGFILSKEDDPQVKLFRRHLALLRPNILVVYDELEAEKEVTWTFQLNGPERSNMKIDHGKQMLVADTDNGDAAVKVFGSSRLDISLADTNYVKPFDWLNLNGVVPPSNSSNTSTTAR
ncbi:DUF4962 domain-containing protein [Bacteroides gallinarum]|uniref:DUF4962 domain-containing protein n=1 Tax=Bacteroides gallinarum TaxID=376806 RepID=UPI000A753DA6|nr:DUF4962 domain-containing protein [Bacteroides gallinarum]